MDEFEGLPHFGRDLVAGDRVKQRENFFVVVHDSVGQYVRNRSTDDAFQPSHDALFLINNVQHCFESVKKADSGDRSIVRGVFIIIVDNLNKNYKNVKILVAKPSRMLLRFYRPFQQQTARFLRNSNK